MSTHPWTNSRPYQKLVRDRQTLKFQISRNNSPYFSIQLRQINASLRTEFNRSRLKYYEKLIDECHNQPKSLSKLLSMKKKQSEITATMLFNGLKIVGADRFKALAHQLRSNFELPVFPLNSDDETFESKIFSILFIK